MFEVRNLSAGYGTSIIVRDVSFRVDEGRFVSILGSNGAGKSTLLKSITGVMRARAGTVLVDGADLTSASAQRFVQHGVAHVPEGRHIFPGLSVRENLIVGGFNLPKRLASKRLSHVVDSLPVLAPLLGRNAGYLSGGEQQMLAIGRALVSQPRLLILDEPTLGLSPIAAETVEVLLRRLNADEGLTILAVEQNVNTALQLADYALVIENGEVALRGSAADLWADEEVLRAYIGI